MNSSDAEIIVDDVGMCLRWRNGIELGCRWAELEEVAVRTAAPDEEFDGWVVLRDGSEMTIPVRLDSDEAPLRAAFARLPGFD